jgi:hypothetical protein
MHASARRARDSARLQQQATSLLILAVKVGYILGYDKAGDGGTKLEFNHVVTWVAEFAANNDTTDTSKAMLERLAWFVRAKATDWQRQQVK